MFGGGKRVTLIDITIIHLREKNVYLESSFDKLLRAGIPFNF